MKWLLVCVAAALCGVAQGRSEDDARIIAARSTKTAISLTTSTTVTPYTCAFLTNAAVCQRRRYRRYSALTPDEASNGMDKIDGPLEGSLLESDPSNREGRIAITIWTTVTTIYTVTSTSINSATTFSLSFYCTVNGASFPPACDLSMKLLILGVCLGVLFCAAHARDSDDLRIVAARSTKTAVFLTTSTTTAPFTCALAIGTNVCQRRSYRRYRRYTNIEDTPVGTFESSALDGTLRQDEADKLSLIDSPARDPRIALTVVFTSSSTYTVTATSTNTAVTFSLSFFCTVNGASYPPRCG
nr:uncharacterized protein LOC128695045 [Cherax quadricarinatus]